MKKNEKENEQDSQDRYLDGAEEFIDTLDDALDEKAERQPTDYRRKIALRAKAIGAKRREAEWKLREKPEAKPKGQTMPSQPKAPSTTTSKPRSDHGEAPQAPSGKSYYWAEPKSGKGGAQ